MSKVDKIFFSFDDLFELLKQRTQLRARGLPADSPFVENIIVTDSEKETAESLFKDAVDDFRNKTGTFGHIKDYGGTLKYTLTDRETCEGMKEAKGLIRKTLLQYLLWAWYDGLGAGDYAGNARAKYEEYLKDVRTVSTQSSFVKPKFHPYF